MLTISAATMPAPSTPSGNLSAVTTTSTYAAFYGCANGTAPFWDGNLDAYVCNGGANYYYPGYYCLDGGYLSGTTCYVSTTTNEVKFSWVPSTTTDAMGMPLVPQVQVVESTSCTSSSWTALATVADSTDSYTVSSPSAAEYYAIRTLNGSTWTGPTTSCTQG